MTILCQGMIRDNWLYSFKVDNCRRHGANICRTALIAAVIPVSRNLLWLAVALYCWAVIRLSIYFVVEKSLLHAGIGVSPHRAEFPNRIYCFQTVVLIMDCPSSSCLQV